MNEVAKKAMQALENCLGQMKQVHKLCMEDPEWQKTIEDGEIALAELSKAMEQQYYTIKQLDSAIEIANVASMHGYRSTEGRDSRAQYLNWAVEFESSRYNPMDRIGEIMKFAEQKIMIEVEADRGALRDTKMSGWFVDRVGQAPKMEFDPTAPENYLQVMKDPKLQDKHQIALNDAFEEQILKVGDKLIAKGWGGYSNFLVSENPLSMNDKSKQISVYFKPARIEGTGNVIGGAWCVAQRDATTKIWETIETIQDGLNRAPEFIADQILNVRNKQLNAISGQNAITLAENNKLPVELANKEYSKTIAGKIIGCTGMHAVMDAGKMAVIMPTANLDRVPERNENVTIAFQQGMGQVSGKELNYKGVGR